MPSKSELKRQNVMAGRDMMEGVNDLDKALKRIAELEFEVQVLRAYGNKDCTAMADVQLEKKSRGEKCEFEDYSQTAFVNSEKEP